MSRTKAFRGDFFAVDTEAYTFIDGEKWSEERIFEKAREIKAAHDIDLSAPTVTAWFRAHATVEVYAWLAYHPHYGFIREKTMADWLNAMAKTPIRRAWFFYAPYDFANMDYQLLTTGWRQVGRGEKPKEQKTYSELSSNLGARYSMTLCAPVDRSESGHHNTAAFTFYDFRNLYKGSLGQLLESFDVRDESGNPIRKLSMDYQGEGDAEEDEAYMLNDVKGLWHLVTKASDRLRDWYHMAIDEGQPDAITASGLAKKVMFRSIYKSEDDQKNARAYRKTHPVTLDLDSYYRQHGLLGGGKVVVNPAFQGRWLHGIAANCYDVNSMYPAFMREMPDITGRPITMSLATYFSGKYCHSPIEIVAYEVDKLTAVCKEGFCPCWQSLDTKKNAAVVEIDPQRHASKMFFVEELEELSNWYKFVDFNISKVWVWHAENPGYLRDFVDSEYQRKKAADSAIPRDEIGRATAKLTMNGAGGKFGQNPHTVEVRREINPDTGAVHLVDGEEIDDEGMILNVVQNAYMTACCRARILREAREMCLLAGKTVADCLLYIDTDSVHALCDWPKTDAHALGWMKKENPKPITEAVYLAPKTYLERWDGGESVHTKGVPTAKVSAALREQGDDLFREGQGFWTLSALNVRGGKCLAPDFKQICRPENGRTEILI